MAETPLLAVSGVEIKRNRSFKLAIPNLTIRAGEITCLLGLNGSGKTTLLELSSGLMLPDKGSLSLSGLNPFKNAVSAKKHLGLIPDDDGWIIAELTAKEYFKLLNSIYKKAGVKTDVYQESLELSQKLFFNSLDQQLGSLSHGNRKKVQIIAALAHHPKLIIVDELRNGLDPLVIKKAENLLVEATEKGAAVLASTHDLWWAERMAKRLLIIQNGKILVDQPTQSIKNRYGSLEARFMELHNA